MSVRTSLISATLLAAVLGMHSAQAALKSPSKVKSSLGTLSRVVDHTGRLIAGKNYTRLPHENDEFTEGSKALEKAIAKEPDDLKSKVEPLLKKAEADSQSLADTASTHDDAKLTMAQAALADSVQAVLAAFPDNIQPGAPSRLHETAEDAKTAVQGK